MQKASRNFASILSRGGDGNSKSIKLSYDEHLERIDERVADWIEVETGLKPICHVQLPDQREQGLIYAWDLDLINAIETKG